MSYASPNHQLKLCLLGDSGVGKSSLKQRFETDEFNRISRATVGMEIAKKDLDVLVSKNTKEKKKVRISLWDTAGQERYNALTRNALLGTAGAILVFDLTVEASFENIGANWLPKIKSECPDAMLLLIGNKSDDIENRAIDLSVVRRYADSNAMFYYETSAKTGDNVAMAFDAFITEICHTTGVFKRTISEERRNIIRLGETTHISVSSSSEAPTEPQQVSAANNNCCF